MCRVLRGDRVYNKRRQKRGCLFWRTFWGTSSAIPFPHDQFSLEGTFTVLWISLLAPSYTSSRPITIKPSPQIIHLLLSRPLIQKLPNLLPPPFDIMRIDRCRVLPILLIPASHLPIHNSHYPPRRHQNITRANIPMRKYGMRVPSLRFSVDLYQFLDLIGSLSSSPGLW